MRGLWTWVADVIDVWTSPRPSRVVVVPDLVGMLAPDAMIEAIRAGVDVSVERAEPNPAPTAGLVVRQSPAAGLRVLRGTRVVLVLLHPPKD
jgi:beta-lactam-binding protein with PASTA domain